MRAWEFIAEGGWDSAKTQGTVITPPVVKAAVGVMQQFTNDFNKWLQKKGLPQVRMGRPTGSGSYIDKDPDDKIYGDLDLQMVAPETEQGWTQTQFVGYWNGLANEFVTSGHAPYVDITDSKEGHPIVDLGNDMYVQVDLMWHPERLEKWGAARVTPEHNVKGLLFGNMFSVFGELLDMSIQHAGVQLKVIGQEQVPFSKRKGTELVTVTTEPTTFVLDTFYWIAQQLGIDRPEISEMLKKYPGNDTSDVKIGKIANSVKGFAESCEQNGMFGKGILAKYASAEDFISTFVNRYTEKAMADVNSTKRDKATTPEAQARAEADRQKVITGLKMVQDYFAR